MMKKKWTKIAILVGILLVIAGGVVLGYNLLGGKTTIVLDGELAVDGTLEYTNEAIQFPMAHVENGHGEILSYDVAYEVKNLKDKSVLEDKYAMFDLKPGKYELRYIYKSGIKVTKTVAFEIQDTQSPVITFTGIPNGLFLQDLDKDTPNKLPLYDIADASKDDGIELTRALMFKGEKDTDFKEVTYRDMNNSYEITEFGQFKYVLTATDTYGNSGTNEAVWKVKDRDWKPEKALKAGYLADYATEGYTNYIEAGDANQYYKIGNDYSDAWLEEYEGAKGVFKIDMGFNNAAGYGNNTIRLHFAKTFTQKDIEGKYLAVRLRVEGENLRDSMLFAGNNVAFRKEDSITRAFSTTVSGVEVGKWKTYYIDAATVQAIGVYPKGTYNPTTTFYEGGKPAECLQLCFARKAGYNNNMTVYIDSISLAEKLSPTEITISGKKATWKKVEGATGYLVNLNGKEKTVTDTSYTLEGKKGYIRVTPLGDGALTLDGEETTAVYGINPGSKLAAFDDELYMDLISEHLCFSTEQEHEGYRPKSLEGKLTKNGLKVDIGTGNWGVVTGIRMLFPKTQAKGSNTTLILNMNVSNAKYGNIRVYDYDGQLMQSIPLDGKNTGKMHKFEIDVTAYDKTLKGIQLIFGPKDMTAVPDGVSVEFKEIYFANTYTKIKVDGKTYSCAGERTLVPGYTTADVVQFTSFYNFGLDKDDTPLTFSGVLLLDGKKISASTVTVVGYPKTDTICFKIPHSGKILTIKKGAVVHNGKVAVKVAETFNMKWNGKKWVAVAKVPPTPKTEYVTVDGKQYELVNKLELVPAYTTKDVVQFTNVNDFGVKADDTPLSFKGIVMVDGQKINNPQFVGYKDNTTICLKTPHNGKLLTILKDSVLYYGKTAVKVTKTFNMKWNGKTWQAVSKVPAVPEDEYITIGDREYKVVAKTELTPGYTQSNLVQFGDVNDFGVSESDTPLNFKGTVLLNGVEVENPVVVGYPNSTTICFKEFTLQNKVLTIMKDSVIYYGDEAVIVKKTFNAKWDGSKWTKVDTIPEPDEKEYVTVDGVRKEVVAKVSLAEGYTDEAGTLVQFTSVYNFGLTEQGPIGFAGTIMLDGVVIDPSAFQFDGYPSNTTICLNTAHKNKVLTIMKGSVIHYGDKAVVITETFNKKWDGSTWTNVAEIPVGIGTLEFGYRYGANNLIQVNTNLPSTTPLVNFTEGDNGCEIDQSANEYQQVGWIQMLDAEGTIVLTFNFNDAFTAGQTYILKKDSLFSFTDGKKYKLDKDYVFTWDDTNWTVSNELPAQIGTLEFAYRYGAGNVIQVNTDLPSTTPLVNFTAEDNGCEIDQSQNQYQQVGWIGMDNVDGTIVLTFHFNSAFEAGQTYILKKDSLFSFTDGKKYKLDKDYVFTWDGSNWTIPTVTNYSVTNVPMKAESSFFARIKTLFEFIGFTW